MNPNFEHAPFEKDLQNLSQEIGEHRIKSNIESLKESQVKDFLKSKLGRSLVSAQVKMAPPASILDESKILPDYLIREPVQVKAEVEKLIGLAFSEGVEKSVKEAVKSGPFVLDALHDALTSKLYEELKKRGLLK